MENHLHRNETTFRNYMKNMDLFREIGIEFVTEGRTETNNYDYAFVGQASIIDKRLSLSESVDKGLDYLSKVTGDYFIIDGQDSTSLIGTIDVFRKSKALKYLKTVYLKDFDLYKKGWANGRIYWGEGDYSVPDIDELKPKMELSGFNWGNTIFPKGDFKFLKREEVQKKYDVCGMFQYPLKEEVLEHNLSQTPYYNKCRKPVYDLIQKTKHSACRLVYGIRLPQDEYQQKIIESKILISPYGFGEYGAPRDVQSAQVAAVLIKPKMDWIDTKPNMYVDGETYISCKEDYSDLEEKVDYVLSNYDELQAYLTENFRKRLLEVYNPMHLVEHTYNIFKNLDGVEV